LLLIVLSTRAETAAAVDLEIRDADGNAAASVVVVATPVGSEPVAIDVAPSTAVMDQINERFVPELLVVRTGTPVAFPNSDQVRHHVYSFSEAKRFELPLYRGNVHEPITFDQAGLVVLGCNIHDHMVGYILVVDTPYFTISDDEGEAAFSGIPPGSYQVSVWHPGMDVPVVVPRQLAVPADARMTIDVESGWKTHTDMALSWDGY